VQYTIVGDSLPAVLVKLEPGESILSELGGRTWARGQITTETKAEGGIGKSLGRALMGESVFMSIYTAQSPAEIGFVSSFPGSIVARQLGPEESIICQKGSFLCATRDVKLAMHMNKKMGAGLVGGEGFIMQRITGPGMVFLEIDGYAQEYDLAPGEPIVVDTGVLAIMDSTCQMNVQMVKGLKNKMLGGEGLFDTVITGPGKVYLQSMRLPNIAKLLTPHISRKKLAK